jgi:hypothetical protein
MRRTTRAVAALMVLASLGCAAPQARAEATPAGPSAVASFPPTTATATSPAPADGNPADEAAIRQLVEAFGKRLQSVSLLAPDAAQEMQQQYSEFVSPGLLQTWMSNPSEAPGRLVSSPWPDRIEITAMQKEAADRYLITGFVVEVTSVEVVNGGAAARIPVRMVVERLAAGWRISELMEQR